MVCQDSFHSKYDSTLARYHVDPKIRQDLLGGSPSPNAEFGLLVPPFIASCSVLPVICHPGRQYSTPPSPQKGREAYSAWRQGKDDLSGQTCCSCPHLWLILPWSVCLLLRVSLVVLVVTFQWSPISCMWVSSCHLGYSSDLELCSTYGSIATLPRAHLSSFFLNLEFLPCHRYFHSPWLLIRRLSSPLCPQLVQSSVC